jgi:hypothetical protein
MRDHASGSSRFFSPSNERHGVRRRENQRTGPRIRPVDVDQSGRLSTDYADMQGMFRASARPPRIRLVAESIG